MARRWLRGVKRVPAFDCRRRRAGFDVTACVLHFTRGGPGQRSIRTLTEKDARIVSAHVHVDRAGEQTQLVPFDFAAYHAGVAEWRYRGEMSPYVNDFSIGIELANSGQVWPDPTRPDGWRYKAGGKWTAYEGPAPEAAELVFDNGLRVRGWWEPFPEAQLQSLEWLLADLPPFDDLFGHEECALELGRKHDPGPRFPWPRFGRPDDDPTRRTWGRVITSG